MFVVHPCKRASNHTWKTNDSAFIISFPIHSLRLFSYVPMTNLPYSKRMSPWNISLFTYSCPRNSPLDTRKNLYGSILFSKKFLTSSVLPNNSIHLLIQLNGTKSYAFLWSSQAIYKLVRLFLQFSNTVLSTSNWSFIPWLLHLHPFWSSGQSFYFSW